LPRKKQKIGATTSICLFIASTKRAQRRRNMTELEKAQAQTVTEAVRAASEAEGLDPEKIAEGIAEGRVLILPRHGRGEPLLIGEGTRTKVNANVGTSPKRPQEADNLRRAEVALAAGADALMDLSTGPNPRGMRERIMGTVELPLGTVPIYELAVQFASLQKPFEQAEAQMFLDAVEQHAQEGIDFVTVHCGVTRSCLQPLQRAKRITGVVSRGGSLTIEWMTKTGQENPYYERFEELIEIAKRYELVLSLGDGLRPGSTGDATDRPQIHELTLLGELRDAAVEAGVQVMIEGPGHVPLQQVEMNVALEKRLCRGAPFYVLGPLVTDVAPGYDHITSAIGGAIAGAAGADFLCYVTPAEHLRLPTPEDVHEGVVASRIAAHAADVAKGYAPAVQWEKAFSVTRMSRDWTKQIELALDPERARQMREEEEEATGEACSMCGEFCAMKRLEGLDGS